MSDGLPGCIFFLRTFARAASRKFSRACVRWIECAKLACYLIGTNHRRTSRLYRNRRRKPERKSLLFVPRAYNLIRFVGVLAGRSAPVEVSQLYADEYSNMDLGNKGHLQVDFHSVFNLYPFIPYTVLQPVKDCTFVGPQPTVSEIRDIKQQY